MEIFRKVTGKGATVVVTMTPGPRVSMTVGGKPVPFAIRKLDAPKSVGDKTIVALLGQIGLTADEHAQIVNAMRPAEPVPVDSKYEHARPYTAEDRAWDRGFERKHYGE